jgi:hypothetical protein
MSTLSSTPSVPQPSRLVTAALTAGIIAIVSNLIIFLAAGSLANITLSIPSPDGSLTPLPLPAIVLTSLVAAFGGVGVYYVISRLTSSPRRIFQIIAFVFLLLSFIPLFTLPIDGNVRTFLLVMHVVTAAVIVGTITISLAKRQMESDGDADLNTTGFSEWS